MTQLSQIVDVVIDRQTKGLTQVGFGTPMVLGLHNRFAERQRIYTDIDGMVADGFLTSDAEYKSVNAIFSQKQRPETVVVGRRTARVAQVDNVTITTVANTTVYSITINGVTYSFTSDGSATGAEIQAGLVLAVNAGSEPVTAVAGAGTSVDLTSDITGTPFTLAVTANLAFTETTANHGVAEDLQSVIDENDDWYWLLLTSRDADDIKVAADDIEARLKMFGACSDEAGVITSSTTDVASKLQDQNYDRTTYLWSEDQITYPEAGWAGLDLPYDPGSETWMFKTIKGSAADILTATQSSYAFQKNANTYEPFAGIDITQKGTVASGEFIDIIRGIDWLKTRMQERIIQKLIDLPKIPYTDAGVAIIENEMHAQLNEGIRKGLLSSYTITVPKVADVSNTDKANRLLPDLVFTAVLAGAVHKVKIRGTVSV